MKKQKTLKPLTPRKTAGTKLDPRRDPQFSGDQFDDADLTASDGAGFLERPLTEDDDTGSPG